MDIAYAIFIMITVFVALPLSLVFKGFKTYKSINVLKKENPTKFNELISNNQHSIDSEDPNENPTCYDDDDSRGRMGFGYRAEFYNS